VRYRGKGNGEREGGNEVGKEVGREERGSSSQPGKPGSSTGEWQIGTCTASRVQTKTGAAVQP